MPPARVAPGGERASSSIADQVEAFVAENGTVAAESCTVEDFDEALSPMISPSGQPPAASHLAAPVTVVSSPSLRVTMNAGRSDTVTPFVASELVVDVNASPKAISRVSPMFRARRLTSTIEDGEESSSAATKRHGRWSKAWGRQRGFRVQPVTTSTSLEHGHARRYAAPMSTDGISQANPVRSPAQHPRAARFAASQFQSSGTLLQTNNLRRRTPSIKPPPNKKSRFGLWKACRREKYRLPIYPKSAAQMRRLEKAAEDVAIFSGACDDHGSGAKFSIGANRLDLKAALFLAMESHTFHPGDFVIRQGERGDKFYIVESGEYEVLLKQRGDAVVHRYVDEGSFGELALLHKLPRASSVRCAVAGKLWSLDKETFRRAFVQHGHPDPTAGFRKAVQQVNGALSGAVGRGTIVPEKLEGLLTCIMPPGVSRAEIAQLYVTRKRTARNRKRGS